MEIWKDIIWYEWLYQVSNMGKVKSLNYNHTWKEKIMKFRKRNNYCGVDLWKNKKWISYSVHRLVAQIFLDNSDNKLQVNHINWIKTDNRIENLEWITCSENIKHAYKTWLNKITENHHFYKNHPTKWKLWWLSHLSKKVNQYDLEWNFIKQWDSLIEIQRWLNIFSACISWVCKWKQKTAWWYIWKYAVALA